MTAGNGEAWLGGEGGFEKHIWVYEHGCGFGHDDSIWAICAVCDGAGGNPLQELPECRTTMAVLSLLNLWKVEQGMVA